MISPIPEHRNFLDLTGKIYGNLSVINYAGKQGSHHIWNCYCLCGNPNSLIVRGNNLKTGNTLSCGCIQKARTSKARRIHGLAGSELYRIWGNMKTRCYNPNHKDFKSYGGRGIKVCDRWLNSFEDFIADMGTKPSPKHSIDRINVDGDYAPQNCRWATQIEQAGNKRNAIKVVFNNEYISLNDLAEITNIPIGKIRSRFRKKTLYKIIPSELQEFTRQITNNKE